MQAPSPLRHWVMRGAFSLAFFFTAAIALGLIS